MKANASVFTKVTVVESDFPVELRSPDTHVSIMSLLSIKNQGGSVSPGIFLL